MNIKKIATVIATGSIMLANAVPAFAAFTTFGETSIVPGGNPGEALQTVSDASPGFGGATFDDANGTLFSSLATLSSDYNVTDDDCGGGSPRFAIRIDMNNNGTFEPFPGGDGNVVVHFGPSPSFTGCATGWQSTGNLISNSDAGRYDSSQVGGSGFGTYAQALAAAGSHNILGINLVIDSSWSADATNGDGEQTVLFDNVNINGTVYNFAPVQPIGVITNPAANGDHVISPVNLTAEYTDEGPDVDAVQWAVRTGSTCNNSAGTVYGNVDGQSDVATWDGQSFSYNATLVPGEYCFVFNPTDDAGQDDVRVTRTFLVDSPVGAVPSACSGMTFSGPAIVGTSSSEKIFGTNGNDLIFAMGGSDVVEGRSGNDCIVGGDGSDKLLGQNGADVILGEAGSDAIEGGNAEDELYGGDDSDSLRGGNASDQLFGENGSDSLRGDNGNDVLDGGDGSDSAQGGAGNQDACTAESVQQCEV